MTVVAVGKQYAYVFWVLCFVALGIQLAVSMCHFVTCGLSGSYLIFPHYLIKGTIFEEKKLLNTKCVFWFFLQLPFETFLILRRTERDIIDTLTSSCKVSVILVGFYSAFNFVDRFPLSTQILNFMKTPPVENELFHADCQRDAHG